MIGMTTGLSGNYNSYGMYGTYNPTHTASSTKPHAVAPDDQVKLGRKSSPNDCDTCKSRKYQDGSNEGDVSFKAPGHISPQASAGTVRAHEQEHVSNAYEKANKNSGQVLSASVTLKSAICPECGSRYVAGGTTTTAIKYTKNTNEENPYQKNQKALAAINQIGSNIDYVA